MGPAGIPYAAGAGRRPIGDSRMISKRFLLPIVTLALAVSACGPGYLDAGKKIAATDQNKQVFEVVKTYHGAVEAKDVDTIRSLVSKRYFENGGTTDDPSDDYGYDKLMPRLEMLVKNVKRVHLAIQLRDMEVAGDTAWVEYFFSGRTLISEGNTDAYVKSDDTMRMRFAKEGGKWLIIGGL